MSGLNSFIPFHGITRQYRDIEGEMLHELDLVMASGNILNGHKKAQFEDQIACRVGREYAICVNSGTNAIHYIFDWLQTKTYASAGNPIWHDRERFPTHPRIAIPNYSFRSTRNAIAARGQAVFIDVDWNSGLMNFQSPGFRCDLDIIMYVNLFGNMINYEELITINHLFKDNKNAVIIEDACQSFGSKFKGKHSGSFGNFSVLSFDPTKNFGSATGGGGMILTDDHQAAAWFYNYLSNGSDLSSHNTGSPSVNSGMSEVDCAGMLVKLRHFDRWQKRRTEIAEYYNDNLHESIITPRHTTTEGVEHCYSKYVILSNKSDAIRIALERVGIETKKLYEALQATVEDAELETMGAAMMANTALSLPIYPELRDSEVEIIVEEINKRVAQG